jgi:small subunit ribosomal protein S13
MTFFLKTYIKDTPKLINSLQAIYGVGEYTIKKVLKINGLLKNTTGKNLREKHQDLIKTHFDKYSKSLSKELKQIYKINCQRLLDNKCYKGIRHKLGYPVRGQRTRTNASTQKKLNERWLVKIEKKLNKFDLKTKQKLTKQKLTKQKLTKQKPTKQKPTKQKPTKQKPTKYKV